MSENGHQSSQSEIEFDRSTLRNRWELASVLNFFKVFDSVIESNLKISAEDVETALIVPNKCLAQLHITLLKGIPPVSKNLKDPDIWIVALSKKLTMWWPWVAEGDFPLTAAKGKEMATYKELDPIIRLVILKALCEIRADQHDVVSYINDGVKNKNELSTFRKNNIGEDGKGTSYWLDGNETIGLRLYKEVNSIEKNGKLPTIGFHWETLATNLEEFQKVVEEYSPSKSKLEVAVSVAVETEAIPVLTKIYKKKQRELQKKNEEEVINNFCRSGITRSCRNRKTVTYTFDEYDKAITEAIRETKRMKTKDEQRIEKKETVANEDSEQQDQPNNESSESDSESSKLQTEDVSEDSGEESDENEVNTENTNHSSKDGKMKTRSKQRSEKKENLQDSEGETTESDPESSEHETVYVSEDSSEDESGEESDESEDSSEDETDEDNKENTIHISKENNNFADKIKSKKVTDNDERSIQQIRNFGTKKRLRQRPNRNTAIVLDSEDEVSSENSDHV